MKRESANFALAAETTRLPNRAPPILRSKLCITLAYFGDNSSTYSLYRTERSSNLFSARFLTTLSAAKTLPLMTT